MRYRAAVILLLLGLAPSFSAGSNAAGPGGDTSGFTSTAPLDRDSEYFISLNPNKAVSGINDYFGVGFTGSELAQPVSHVHVMKRLATGGVGNLHLCDGVSDTTCQPKDWDGITIFSVIGNCATDINGGCVKSLSFTLPNGKVIEAKPLNLIPTGSKGIKGQAPTQGNGAFPAGHSTWIWRATGISPGGEEDFLLSGVITSGGMANTAINGQWSIRPDSFRFEVFPITRELSPLLKAPVVREYAEQPSGRINVGIPIQQSCLAVDEGVCFHKGKFVDGVKIKVVMEIPKSISGWLNGRLKDPVVSVKPLNSSFDQIEIAASPAEDILGGGYVLKSSVSTSDWAWRDLITGGSSAKTFAGQMISGQNSFYVGNAGDAGALEWFKAWESKIGNKALRSSKAWSIASTRSPSTGACLQQSGGIGGIISTNAAVYEPGAPTMNSSGTTLSYRVAGPLKDSEGRDLIGVYSMSLANSLLSCLYKVDQIPNQVQIGIVNANGDRKVQTASLINKDGWANFSAAGFSYEDASFLEVSIVKQSSSTATPNTASSASGSDKPVTGSANTSSTKSTTIKCVKGKTIVTVKAKKCPTGYSKKS